MNGEVVDRLTNLPHSIIHHILSFLDAKSSVQTSVLSRPWKSAWKHLSVLNLHGDSFQDIRSFTTFLDNISTLLCPENKIRKISYYVEPYKPNEQRIDLVLNLAAALGIEASIHRTDSRYLYNMFGPKTSSDELGLSPTSKILSALGHLCGRWFVSDVTRPNCNLKSLTAHGAMIDVGSSPAGFPMLTSLTLHDFSWLGSIEFVDPFRKFPCLKDLALHSGSIGYLKVSGFQLVSLELKISRSVDVIVDAPKLESLALDFRSGYVPRFVEMNVPSLSRLSFLVDSTITRREVDGLAPVFRSCPSAKFVAVNSRVEECQGVEHIENLFRGVVKPKR